MPAGSHDVESWVSGLEIAGERGYIVDGDRILIASFRKEVGWIW